MNIKVTLPTIDGLTLNTKGKYVAENIDVIPTIPKYNGSVTEGAVLDETLKALIERTITEVTIPEGYTKVGDYSFRGCLELESVTVPSSVKSIDYGAFSGCKKLSSVTLNEGLEYILQDAFLNCSSLNYLVIPTSVQYLDSNSLTMGSSTNKVTIKFLSSTPPNIIQSSVFKLNYLEKIEVPMSAVDTYKEVANMSTYANYIVGYEEE